jgi:PAP2 superfamily protein
MKLERLLLVLVLLAPAAAGASTSSRIEEADSDPVTVVADSSSAPSTPAVSGDTASAPVTIVEREHRNLFERAGRAATNFGSDCWHVASSPARMTPRGLAALGLILGVEAVIYANDQEIFDATQRNDDAPVLHEIHKVGEVLEDAGFMPYALEAEGGVWLIGGLFHSSTTQQICQELVEAHLIGGGIRNGLKYLVGRAHPYEGRGPRVYEFGTGTSFPSGHTSIYYEAATILSHHAHSTPVTVLLYGIATVGAIHRVQARAHWASDVFLPIFSGTLIGHAVIHRNQERIDRDRSRWTPRIQAGEDGVRVGIGRNF